MDSVHKVERQVVAGMNYRVTVSLKSTCVIPGGARESVLRCEAVKVFQPLPFSCNSPNPDNPKCMELTEADITEKCSSDRELPSPPPGGLPGGFSNAGEDPALTDVLDFAKLEAKNSLLQKYGVNYAYLNTDMHPTYRRFHIQSNTALQGDPSGRRLHFVDLDFGISNDLLILFGQSNMVELPNISQQKIVADLMGHPVLLYHSIFRFPE